ncbi:MAG: AAA family ATPase, partial [Saprospiraceae bacterium]|nr:AAA family ATPase [Saprospiraceae bacterium]
MLIEFTVGNYRSFKDKKTLRMDAASSVSEYRENLIPAGKYNLLRSAAIYGANASGKSNLLRAMGRMRSNVLHSASWSSSASIPFDPFLLNETTPRLPSYFEVVFKIKDARYRYGFEFDKSRIYTEWLFESKKDSEKPFFIRDEDKIQVSKKFSEGKGLEKRTKPNTLFLSVCDQFNGSKAKELMAWVEGWSLISFEAENPADRVIGRQYDSAEEAALTAEQLQFVKKLDLGIKDIFFHPDEVYFYDEGEEGPSVSSAFMMTPKTVHQKFNDNGDPVGQVEFDMDKAESSGTNKLFDLSGSLFNCLN